MSPRAAWRLEAAGFSPVHDYAAGKSDWIAADLPFEGTAAAMRDSGTDAALMDAVARQFRKAADGGHGGEDMAAVYRAFRP